MIDTLHITCPDGAELTIPIFACQEIAQLEMDLALANEEIERLKKAANKWQALATQIRLREKGKDAEIRRLERMIRYTLEGPDDPKSLKTILTDALDGMIPEVNFDKVRGERKALKAEVERLKAELAEAQTEKGKP